MTNKPILYSFRRCPYAMRARIFIRMCEIEVELREVLLKDIPEEMINISPKATVPVLQLNDGTVLDESLDIMNWAIDKNDKCNLKKSKLENIEISNEIINIFDGEFKYHLDRYKYNSRYDKNEGVQTKEKHRDEALKILQIIESKLNNKVIIDLSIGELSIENASIPSSISVSQNFPNPFNPSTSFDVVLPYAQHLKIDIYRAHINNYSYFLLIWFYVAYY